MHAWRNRLIDEDFDGLMNANDDDETRHHHQGEKSLRSRGRGDDDDDDDSDDVDDDNDDVVTTNNNKLELLHTNTRVPEFAFGGQWGATRNQAKLNEHTSPTFGCHATTSMHIKNPDTDKLEVLVAWFGGSYEGAEDVGIWTARRDEETGMWTKPK